MPPSPEDDYTPFDGLFSGTVGTHEQGTFQIEGSGEGFRFKKTIIANLPFQTKTIRDNFKVQLVESEEDDARVLFEMNVNFGIHVQAIDGPIPIFIARPADDEQISTTIINGETIEPGRAVEFLDLGYRSEFGITTDFTASPGVNGGGEITGEWQSLPYLQEVYEGNVFRVRQDGWRPIGLSKLATYKVSYKPGAPYFAALFDDVAALRVASNRPGAVHVAHSYDNVPFVRARLRGFKEPSVWKDERNRMWLAAIHENRYRLYFSLDDGRSWTVVDAASITDPTQKEAVTIFDSSFKFPRTMPLPGGGVLACAVRGRAVWVIRSSDGLDWSGPTIRAGAITKNEPFIPLADARTGALRLTNGRGTTILSLDGGFAWAPVIL